MSALESRLSLAARSARTQRCCRRRPHPRRRTVAFVDPASALAPTPPLQHQIDALECHMIVTTIVGTRQYAAAARTLDNNALASTRPSSAGKTSPVTIPARASDVDVAIEPQRRLRLHEKCGIFISLVAVLASVQAFAPRPMP